MTTEKLNQMTVSTKANVYFDGICVSHSLTAADGTQLSVGVVLASELRFSTGAAEIMECSAGSCEYRLAGTEQWLTSTAGEKFSIPANSYFDIKVAEAYHYICHYA